MKNIQMKLFLVVLFLSLYMTNAFSQFEQKFTINFSVGYFQPMGANDYIYTEMRTPSRLYLVDGDAETEFVSVLPYIMSNFDPGFLITGGIQYNINRRFSIAANVTYLKNFNWSYQYYYFSDGEVYDEQYLQYVIPESKENWGWEWDANHDGDVDDIIDQGENTYSLFNLGLGVAPKFYLVVQGKIKPYVFVEGNFNYTSIDYQNNRDPAWEKVLNDYADEIGYTKEITLDYDPLTNMLDKSIGFGAYPGVGLDIQANENLGIFLQGGYSIIFLNKDEMEDNNLEPENFKAIRIEGGIKLSFLKSKDF